MPYIKQCKFLYQFTDNTQMSLMSLSTVYVAYTFYELFMKRKTNKR